ncbi:MAG: hypothetical protein WBE11_04520, partial [Candidatus Aminicenantaceae bacterium]
MRRNKNLKLFGLVVILSLALVFIGIDFVEGQVKTQGKPPKLPRKGRYEWSAVILNDPGFGLRGIEGTRYDEFWPGWVYSNSESNVNVGVEIRRAPFDGVDKYWT